MACQEQAVSLASVDGCWRQLRGATGRGDLCERDIRCGERARACPSASVSLRGCETSVVSSGCGLLRCVHYGHLEVAVGV